MLRNIDTNWCYVVCHWLHCCWCRQGSCWRWPLCQDVDWRDFSNISDHVNSRSSLDVHYQDDDNFSVRVVDWRQLCDSSSGCHGIEEGLFLHLGKENRYFLQVKTAHLEDQSNEFNMQYTIRNHQKHSAVKAAAKLQQQRHLFIIVSWRNLHYHSCNSLKEG